MSIPKLSLLAIVASIAPTVLAQVPTPLAAPYSGFSYYGCYTDNMGYRALANRGPATPGGDGGMTIEKCIDVCGTTYDWVGLQYFYECWCGNDLNTQSLSSPITDCQDACRGDGTEACGGSNRLSIYSNGEGTGGGSDGGSGSGSGGGSGSGSGSGSGGGSGGSGHTIPTDIGNGYTYVNCYADTNADRAVSGLYFNNPTTLEACATACKAINGAIYLAMDYYGECFCGSSLNTAGGLSTGCTFVCNEETTETCGGEHAAQVYQRAPDPVDPRSSSRAAAEASRASVTSSRLAASAVASASKAAALISITSSREAAAASRLAASDAVAASKLSVTSSRLAASAIVQASKDSVTSSRQAASDAIAASQLAATSSRAEASAAVVASHAAAAASISSVNSVLSVSRAAANAAISASRAAASNAAVVSANAAAESKASVTTSKQLSSLAASASKASASASRAAANAAASASRAAANAAISASRESVNASKTSSLAAAAASRSSSRRTTTTTTTSHAMRFMPRQTAHV